MTTQELAVYFVKLIKAGNAMQIYNELYSEDIICKEPDHAIAMGVPTLTTGIANVLAKTKARMDIIAEVHSNHCSEPVVGGGYFSVSMGRDMTFKNGQRVQVEEIAVYGVKDGKIVTETFFY